MTMKNISMLLKMYLYLHKYTVGLIVKICDKSVEKSNYYLVNKVLRKIE